MTKKGNKMAATLIISYVWNTSYFFTNSLSKLPDYKHEVKTEHDTKITVCEFIAVLRGRKVWTHAKVGICILTCFRNITRWKVCTHAKFGICSLTWFRNVTIWKVWTHAKFGICSLTCFRNVTRWKLWTHAKVGTWSLTCFRNIRWKVWTHSKVGIWSLTCFTSHKKTKSVNACKGWNLKFSVFQKSHEAHSSDR